MYCKCIFSTSIGGSTISSPFFHLQVQQSVPEGEESSQVKDLTEKLAILQHKRQEDKARIKELERYKAQCQQVREYTVLFRILHFVAQCLTQRHGQYRS